MSDPPYTTKVPGNPILSADWNSAMNAMGRIPNIALTPEQPANYTVYSTGSSYYSRNGHTGIIDFSGSSANTVITSTLNALTSGRTWKEKVVLKGSFTVSSAVAIPGYTIFELDGIMTLAAGSNCNIIETPFGGSYVDPYIDLVGGWYDGNKTNNPSGGVGIMFTVYAGSIYGVRVINSKSHAFQIGKVGSNNGAIENLIYRCWADSAGGDGYYFHSTATDCFVHHSWAQSCDYAGLHNFGNALFVNGFHNYDCLYGMQHTTGQYCKYEHCYQDTNKQHGFFIDGGAHSTLEIAHSYFLGNGKSADNTYDDIRASGTIGNYVDGLKIVDNTFNPYGASGSRYNINIDYPNNIIQIEGNDFRSGSAATCPVHIGSSGSATIKYIIDSNYGYVSQTRGVTHSVGDNTAIYHNLGYFQRGSAWQNITPTWVIVSPSVSGEIASVTNIDTDHFHVAIKKISDGSGGTSQDVYWSAGIY